MMGVAISVTNRSTIPQPITNSVFGCLVDVDEDGNISIESCLRLGNDTLYVPISTVDAYRTADVWKEFGYIIEELTFALEVTGYNISPAFNPDITTYTLKVPNSVQSITINSTTNGNVSFDGIGLKYLNVGENPFYITVNNKTYLFVVTRAVTNDVNPNDPATVVATQDIASLQIYPNPFVNGQFTIDNGQSKSDDKVEIFNMSGSLLGIHNISGGTTTVINVANLPAGMYIVKVGGRETKIVKQ
jgi:hypothetical protein